MNTVAYHAREHVSFSIQELSGNEVDDESELPLLSLASGYAAVGFGALVLPCIICSWLVLCCL